MGLIRRKLNECNNGCILTKFFYKHQIFALVLSAVEMWLKVQMRMNLTLTLHIWDSLTK